MTLTEIGGGGINYIQSSAPSSPEDKEIWIDVSSSPPLVKVYDADNSTWESATNVLSDGTRFDGANIDAAISSVGGVDWASKTPNRNEGYVSNISNTTETILSVTGSGYISSIFFKTGTQDDSNEFVVDVDGTNVYASSLDIGTYYDGETLVYYDGATQYWYQKPNVACWRFDSSFTLKITEAAGKTIKAGAEVYYVLD